MTTNIKKIIASAFVVLAFQHIHAGDLIELSPSPTADGEISSQGSLDDQPEAVNDLALGAKVGMFYGKLFTSVFEFSLPPGEEKKIVSKATLEFASNTLSQESNSTPSPITIEVFGYSGKNADGVVDTSDWQGGNSLGVAIVKGDDISRFGKLPSIEVTEFVQKAIKEGSKFVGFRLQPKDLEGTQKEEGLVIRTAEFGQQFAGNQPKLQLLFGE